MTSAHTAASGLSSTLSGTTTYTISGTSNQLTALSGVTTQSFTWNADGNQTGDGTHSYGYDGRALLTTETTSGVVTNYGIDWQGQRLTKSGTNVPNGGTNEYVYDEGGHLIGEYGSTGHIVNETVWLPDTPVSTVVTMATGNVGTYFGTNGIASPAAVLTTTNAATVSPVTPDWLNAPHIVTNSTKGYQWIWDHYAFGDNAPNQNPAGLGAFTYNPRFPGQYANSESGLNYNWNRSYGPTWGSYIQADPIGLAGGQASLYPYVGANPLILVDPKGLWPEGPFGITLFPDEKARAEKSLPKLLQKLVPTLTPQEAQELSQDTIDELGMGDIGTAQSLQQCRNLNDLTTDQKRDVYIFLSRLPSRDQTSIKKLKDVLGPLSP